MELEILIKQYLEIQKQEAAIKAQKESLKDQIIRQMGAEKTYKSADGVGVQIQEKVSFKYSDEKGLIECLENIGKGEFVKKVVNATSFNSVLKSYDYKDEAYAPYIEKTTTIALVVK